MVLKEASEVIAGILNPSKLIGFKTLEYVFNGFIRTVSIFFVDSAG